MIKGYAFTKIIVADLALMERFYCDSLGLKVQARIAVDKPGWALRETILTFGDPSGTLLNLVQYLDRPCPAPGEAVIGLSVDSIDAVIDAATRGGGSVATPPVDVPDHGLRIAYIADPEGHLLELLQPLG